MCQLFGFNGKKERNLSRELKEFYSHSDRHPHGWGLAYGDKTLNIIKEPVKASDCQLLHEVLAQGIHASNVLGHIRFATIGQLNTYNCHPFTLKDHTGRVWTLVHNGTIFNDRALRPYKAQEKGDTDSECILHYIVDTINRTHAKSDQERFQVVSHLLTQLAEGNKLNILLFDGTTYYVHTNQKNTLYTCKTKDGILFCTEPLSVGYWHNAAFNQVIGYQNGRKVFAGVKHHYEYIEDLKRYKKLHIAYA